MTCDVGEEQTVPGAVPVFAWGDWKDTKYNSQDTQSPGPELPPPPKKNFRQLQKK